MKQLILLVLLTGMVATSAFALGPDATTGSAPRPISCTDDPLHPIAGKPYDYTAILAPAAGTTYWYATKSTTFVSTTGGIASRVATEILTSATTILSTATNYRTPGASATSPTKTNVTWASEVLKGVDATNPLFMVLEYKGPTCSNNMKVYQILPKNAFTVDILNLKTQIKRLWLTEQPIPSVMQISPLQNMMHQQARWSLIMG